MDHREIDNGKWEFWPTCNWHGLFDYIALYKIIHNKLHILKSL